MLFEAIVFKIAEREVEIRVIGEMGGVLVGGGRRLPGSKRPVEQEHRVVMHCVDRRHDADQASLRFQGARMRFRLRSRSRTSGITRLLTATAMSTGSARRRSIKLA